MSCIADRDCKLEPASNTASIDVEDFIDDDGGRLPLLSEADQSSQPQQTLALATSTPVDCLVTASSCSSPQTPPSLLPSFRISSGSLIDLSEQVEQPLATLLVSGEAETATERPSFLTTSAATIECRSHLSHLSFILEARSSHTPSMATTQPSSASLAPSTFSQSTSSSSSTPTHTFSLLPLAPSFYPSSVFESSSASPQAAVPLVPLDLVRESAGVDATALAASSQHTDMADTSQPPVLPPVLSTPPKATPQSSPLRTTPQSSLCQTPVWVTAPPGVGAMPSPTLTSFQVPSSPADNGSSPKCAMSFSVPSPAKSVGSSPSSPTRVKSSGFSPLSPVFQPSVSGPNTSPYDQFQPAPPSRAIPITPPSPTRVPATLNPLNEIPECEDQLIDDSNDTNLADQLAKARALHAVPSSRSSSVETADLRRLHTPLDRNLYRQFDDDLTSPKDPNDAVTPKGGKYGDISLSGAVTQSSASQSVKKQDSPDATMNSSLSLIKERLSQCTDTVAPPSLFGRNASHADDNKTVVGSDSGTTDVLKVLRQQSLFTEPLAIAAPGFRPQSSAYDADNETDNEAGAECDRNTETETEGIKIQVAARPSRSVDSCASDDIAEKPFPSTATNRISIQGDSIAQIPITAGNGLEEGVEEVGELERLWSDLKDNIAIFGGGVEEVIARLNKELKQ